MKVTHNAPPNPQVIDRAKPAEKTRAPEKAVATTEGKPISPQGSLVNISDDAKLMRQATDIVKSLPDVRADKVQALKKRIEEGKYQVDAAEIADRLLKEHLSTDFGKNNL
jgi:flagellar biosynthesis anti-sigma factor FlgM